MSKNIEGRETARVALHPVAHISKSLIVSPRIFQGELRAGGSTGQAPGPDCVPGMATLGATLNTATAAAGMLSHEAPQVSKQRFGPNCSASAQLTE